MQRIVAAMAGLLLLAPGHARADQQLRQRPVYTLHTGDEIALNYRYTPEFNQTVTVQPDGSVNLDIVGDVQVEGLSVDQARKRIVAMASARLNHPELTITLVHFQAPYIVVAGEVDRPGKYDINDSTTALQAIMLAGGFKDSALDTKVYLFRRINADDAEVRKINLHNIKNQADLERDTELEPGDMLLVTRNRMEHFSRIMKAGNLGVFLSPYNATLP